MRDLGIEFLCVFGLPPVEFVNLAADLGCRYITTTLASFPFDFDPHGYPQFSLRDDKALRRDMNAAMRDRGVSISLGEGFFIGPGVQAADFAADLDVMCELGVKRINTIGSDPDVGRSFDQFAILAEMAAAAGVETTLEFCPSLAVADLTTALAAVRHVGRRDFRLTIDTMHLVRSGATAADIAALDPDMIGYVQLCDVPLSPTIPNYGWEATYERLPPGEGEAPLAEILAALPSHLPHGLEIPMRAAAEAGLGPRERVGRCVDAARRLVDQLA